MSIPSRAIRARQHRVEALADPRRDQLVLLAVGEHPHGRIGITDRAWAVGTAVAAAARPGRGRERGVGSRAWGECRRGWPYRARCAPIHPSAPIAHRERDGSAAPWARLITLPPACSRLLAPAAQTAPGLRTPVRCRLVRRPRANRAPSARRPRVAAHLLAPVRTCSHLPASPPRERRGSARALGAWSVTCGLFTPLGATRPGTSGSNSALSAPSVGCRPSCVGHAPTGRRPPRRPCASPRTCPHQPAPVRTNPHLSAPLATRSHLV